MKINKVLVSGLILSTLLTSTTAFATDTSDLDDWLNMSIEDAVDKALQETQGQADKQTQTQDKVNRTTQATTAPIVSSFPDVKSGELSNYKGATKKKQPLMSCLWCLLFSVVVYNFCFFIIHC